MLGDAILGLMSGFGLPTIELSFGSGCEIRESWSIKCYRDLGFAMTFPRAIVVRVAAALLGFSCAASVATIAANHHTAHSSKSKSAKISESASTQKKMAKSRHSSKTAATRNRSTHSVTTATSKSKRHRYYERFSGNSFALDQTEGDITAGEDPVVRAAA